LACVTIIFAIVTTAMVVMVVVVTIPMDFIVSIFKLMGVTIAFADVAFVAVVVVDVDVVVVVVDVVVVVVVVVVDVVIAIVIVIVVAIIISQPSEPFMAMDSNVAMVQAGCYYYPCQRSCPKKCL
jgi:hypothetical protein